MNELIYDAENIRKLLIDFNLLTGINISFASFDYKFVVSLPDTDNAFCRKLRENPYLKGKCLECDRAAFQTAEKHKDFYIYECHAGLTEAISPVTDNNSIIGYLFMGKVLTDAPSKEMWNNIRAKFREYDLDFVELERCFYKCPSLSREKIKSAASIMDISAKYICLTKLAKVRARPLLENIKDYIDSNLNVTTNELSEKFNISQSYLCHTFRKELDMTISDYKLQKRIVKAKDLLEKTELSVGNICEYAGFNDQNFFARVFKKNTSLTPTQYRTKFKKITK